MQVFHKKIVSLHQKIIIMNKTISFSFVMPAYKSQFLSKTIESILKQTYSIFELIIINDASPENIKEIVDHFHDEKIRYEENKENIGGKDLVANWNHCIQYAKNDYLILATDDDTFEPEFLSETVRLIKKYPHTNLIRSGVKKIDEKDQILDIEFPLKEFMTSWEFALCWAKGQTISCVSNYIFKKEALLSKGGFINFPHAHFSDDATALALAEQGVANIQENCMNFRMSTINLSNQGNYQIALQQIRATDEYMGWYLSHIKRIKGIPGDFFERACYGGCKNKYIYLVKNLVTKIPITKMYLTTKTVFSLKHLFRKEKIKILLEYFTNKI